MHVRTAVAPENLLRASAVSVSGVRPWLHRAMASLIDGKDSLFGRTPSFFTVDLATSTPSLHRSPTIYDAPQFEWVCPMVRMRSRTSLAIVERSGVPHCLSCLQWSRNRC